MTLQKEHELALLGMKGEQAAKIADYERKLKDLQQEVEKYRILAGIESLTYGLGDDEQLTTSTHKPVPKLQSPEEQSPQHEVWPPYSFLTSSIIRNFNIQNWNGLIVGNFPGFTRISHNCEKYGIP